MDSLPHARADGATADIDGVRVRPLDPIGDMRGSLCEVHRDTWDLAPRPVQWDFIFSKAGTLRGVHVHRLRWDFVVVLEGHATIGLKDIRRAGRSFGNVMAIDIPDGRPTVVTIPPGVAHGVFASTALRYLYGLTVPWDGADEDLGCRYDDAALAIPWPNEPRRVLPRDLELPDFATLVERYDAMTRGGSGSTSSSA
jgi:dTDP-4-dehydrorhamnose 3,5-epimerase